MKNIKKVLYAVLLCCMVMGLCACGSGEESGGNSGNPVATATPKPVGVKNKNNKGTEPGKTFTIPVYVDMQLSEYEKETNQAGEIVENGIYCGERYKMTLDGSIYGRKELDGREFELEIKVAFNQGAAETAEFYYVPEGGYDFKESETESGVYVARTKVSETIDLDFSKGYFVVGVDYINATEKSTSQQLVVEVEITPILSEDSHDKVNLKINNLLESKLTNYVTILKGNFNFTEEDNVRYGIGREVEETTVKFIEFPEECQGITIAFYDDEKRQVHYGTTELLSPKKREDTLYVVLADYVKEYKGGEDEFEEMLSNGAKTFYLTITAFGGDSYNDVAFDMEYVFE